MKKISILFAIIIAMVAFTSCEKAPVYYQNAPTEITADGPGITIPGDSVYFEYQYPVLGKWIDCNLKNQGNKKLLGWITKGEWKKTDPKFISDSELNAAKYSYTGDSGIVILKSTINDVTKVATDDADGSGGSVSNTAASAPSFRPGFVDGPEDHSYSIFGLGCFPSILLTIFLILAIWYLLKKLFGGNGSSNPGASVTSGNQQSMNTSTGSGGNVQWSISPDSTVTINTVNSVVSIDPDATIRGSRK